MEKANNFAYPNFISNNSMKEKGISYSDSHINIFSNQYPMEEIERAYMYANHTSYRGPIFLLIMGLLFTFGHLVSGIIIVAIAVIWGLSIQKKYSLILTIKGEAKSVLIHNNKKLIAELLKAIKDVKGR